MADDYFDPFGNDDFDSIVRSFFGDRTGRKTRVRQTVDESDEEESELGFIENKDSVFLVLEFPGYIGEEVSVNVKDKVIEIRAKKISVEGMQDYLANKFKQGIVVSRKLPDFVSTKKFDYNFKNGILEVRFDKK